MSDRQPSSAIRQVGSSKMAAFASRTESWLPAEVTKLQLDRSRTQLATLSIARARFTQNREYPRPPSAASVSHSVWPSASRLSGSQLEVGRQSSQRACS